MTKKKKENEEEVSTIGLALAGHAFRAAGHPKAAEYANPLTGLVTMIIADAKAKASIAEQTNKENNNGQ